MTQTQTMLLRRAVAITLSATILLGCGGVQSTLNPKGPGAHAIANISWVMFAGAGAILLVVMVLALIAVLRAPGKRGALSESWVIIGGGLIFPLVTLTALLAYGVYQMGNLRTDAPQDAVRIAVTGNQWWWDIHYLDEAGNPDVIGANEIRIPAGVPVSIFLRSNDVIHSLWVPNLAGKMDLIPGRTNHLRLHADRPGTFRGQCAEYCGAQHAHMSFLVIATSLEEYQAWLTTQRQPAVMPTTELSARGRAAFAEHCLQCHTVRGLGNAKENGPDLTHVASRRFIGAGRLDNNRTNLLRFIVQSQSVKPGNRMPEFGHLDQEVLDALLAYLEALR